MRPLIGVQQVEHRPRKSSISQHGTGRAELSARGVRKKQNDSQVRVGDAEGAQGEQAARRILSRTVSGPKRRSVGKLPCLPGGGEHPPRSTPRLTPRVDL